MQAILVGFQCVDCPTFTGFLLSKRQLNKKQVSVSYHLSMFLWDMVTCTLLYFTLSSYYYMGLKETLGEKLFGMGSVFQSL